MLHYACLFAHDQASTPESDWNIDNGHVDGWAEWFEQMPLLFLYLIGDAQQLPQIAPCTIYGGSESPACLMTPMAAVRRRWLALHEHVQRQRPRWSSGTQAQWEKMHATITTTTRQWLILDCGMLVDVAIGTPEMDAFLHQLQQRCGSWGEVSTWEASDLPPALQPLLEEHADQWGWWSPAVIERIYAVDQQPYEEWPPELREYYEPAREAWPWMEEVQAYLVHPVDRSGDLGAPDEYGNRRCPVGLVTPYGRWLVHPDEGARWISIDQGYLCIHQLGEWPEGTPSGLKDLNGQWVVPVSAGYLNLFPVTKTLALGRRGPRLDDEGRLGQLLRWPEGEVLFDGVSGAWLHEDGRVRVTHADDTQSVLDAVTGEPLFEARYKDVFAFHKKLRLAVVVGYQPGDPSPDHPSILQGVVHESGRLVIPCAYTHIHHAYKQPPKLLHGRQLLAITADGRPHFYSVDGKLLATPDCNVKPWMWTPMVKNNHLVAFDRDDMDARVVAVSLADYSFTYTGETRADCVEMIRQGLSGWRPK